MRSLIYAAKNAIHRNPALYERLYRLATRNPVLAAQLKEPAQYPSKFGGMWTDRADFEAGLAARLADGRVTDTDVPRLRRWRDDGVVVMPGLLDDAAIQAYQDEVSTVQNQSDSPFLMTTAALPTPEPYTPERAAQYASVRMVDDYFHCPASRALAFHPDIRRFLEMVLEGDPILTQTLRFEYGSEQPLHQDAAFVRMTAPMMLVGVWIALEDITPGSGELLYLPGSHRWEGPLFSDRFKHYDKDRDGEAALAAWHQWILDEAAARVVTPQPFSAKKGDVLFWHAGLAHGGAPITNAEATRLSLVAHFCPDGVRPLYHFYKPRHRKIYRDAHGAYTTSYYR